MIDEGPQLNALTHRLSECPPEFQQQPRQGQSGAVDVAAIVCDHFRAMQSGEEKSGFVKQVEMIRGFSKSRQQLIAFATWLLHEPWFLEQRRLNAQMWQFLLGEKLGTLAETVRAELMVTDPDRREELVRICLHALGLRPRGETIAQATDRLNTLDSVERNRVVLQTRSAEARARKIREGMTRRAAQEAAARYSPE